MTKFIEVHDYSTGCTTLVNVDCIHSIPKVERTAGSKYTALYCDDEVIRVSETYTELRQMISNATGGLASCVPTVDPQWVPCKEQFPPESTPVNVVFVNHSPEKYYAHIKDKPFTATALYCRGDWYWYSATCEDVLREYGENMPDLIDKGIEITHWQPLPEPPRE